MTSQDRYRKIGLAARLDLTSLLEISDPTFGLLIIFALGMTMMLAPGL